MANVKSEPYLMEVWSGGQNGVDQAALYAARDYGLKTGGFMPKGWITLDGPRPDLAEEFGMLEMNTEFYPPRTYLNVQRCDVTLRLAYTFLTAGEKCTEAAILKYGKPSTDVHLEFPPDPREVAAWLTHHQVRRLNVAGNSNKTRSFAFDAARNYLNQVFEALGLERKQ